MSRHSLALVAAACLAGALPAQAALQNVTVTVQNLAPASGIAFAPLHIGFHNGSFDSFNLGGVAGAGIISVAEGGSGTVWQADFAAAQPSANRGTVGGLLLAGATASLTLTVHTALNPYFSFGAMVVPSNDFFIGNDDPMEYRVFGPGGNLAISSIGQSAREIWDAGSEVFDAAAAAFVGNNGLRADQNSVVAFNFAELAAFDGLTTGAGYVFTSGLAADTSIYRISFVAAPVPEPTSAALLLAGLAATGWLGLRRRQADVTSA
jgi:PEP-CTERM motif